MFLRNIIKQKYKNTYKKQTKHNLLSQVIKNKGIFHK